MAKNELGLLWGGSKVLRQSVVFVVLLLNLILLACHSPTAGNNRDNNRDNNSDNNGIDLLSVGVHDSKSLPFDDFNKRLSDESADKASWGNDPISILQTFIGTSTRSNNIIYSLNKIQNEGRSTYVSIVIFDGIPDDDSIRGYRYDIELDLLSNDSWQIKSAMQSWRCWKNRGHTDFSSENCA
jgi:hypothetical protein